MSPSEPPKKTLRCCLSAARLGGRRLRGGGVDVAQPLLAVAYVSLALKLREHRSYGGIARGVCQALADVLGGVGVPPCGKQEVHDLALTACELLGRGGAGMAVLLFRVRQR